MRMGRASLWSLVVMLLFVPLHAWQDDLEINLRHPFESFSQRDGADFFGKALAEMRVGRYLKASENHVCIGQWFEP
jgi:hypothetical protein